MDKVLDERYRFLDQIGSGGFSTVYTARDMQMDRVVAVKILKPTADQDLLVKRFQRETKTLSSLQHENLVKVFSCGETEEHLPFLVMEYVQGETLEARIRSKGKLTAEEFVPILLQICSALDAVHNGGIVHRDLKPGNILLTQSGETPTVKVVDFGIAKVIESDAGGTQEKTTTGPIGSPHFMSPEQCSSAALDARSDIYALGCLIYYAITGRELFAGNSALEIMSHHIHDQPDLSLFPRKNPHESKLFHIVERCLQKNPTERISSAAEVKRIIGRPLSEVKLNAWLTPKNVKIALVLVLLVGTSLVFSLYAAQKEEEAAKRRIQADYYADQGDDDHRRRNDSSLEPYNKALAIDPTCWRAYSGRAFVYLSLEHSKPKEALENAENALRFGPKNDWTLFVSRAYAHYFGGDYKAALADFDRAIELCQKNPGSNTNHFHFRIADCYRGRAHTKLLLGDKAGALADLEAGSAYVPVTHTKSDDAQKRLKVRFLVSRALVNLNLGRNEDALEYAKEVINVHQNMAEGHALAAQAYWQLGQRQRCDEALNDALELDPADASTAWLHATLYGPSNDYERGIPEHYNPKTKVHWY